jgi:hypothetical protein
MTTDNECPPPEMTSRPDGSMHYRPHCWKCAPKVKQLNEPTRPAPVTTGQRTKADDWRTDDVARFVIETCQCFGHTLDWLIENYSATTTTGTITASKAPDEFQRRLNNLYTMMPKAARRREAADLRADAPAAPVHRQRPPPGRQGQPRRPGAGPPHRADGGDLRWR